MRPASNEHSDYYAHYVSLVPDGDLATTLSAQLERTLAKLKAIPEARGTHSYAAGKWTIKEVVGHMSDTERVMAYRAFRIARGDETPLASFDQDAYVRTANSNTRSLGDLADEFAAVRRASIALFAQLDDDALARFGTASDNPVTARAVGYIIAGHELHHMGILEGKYLK